MRTLELFGVRGRGKSLFIDDEDFEYLWHKRIYLDRDGYPWFHDYPERGRRKFVLVHRYVMGAQAGIQVDHINGDKLDARRVNLRFVTNAENCSNQHRVRGRSHFKGVHFCPRNGNWRASIMVAYIRINLGRFDSQEEAARAYDRAATHYFGEHARTNEHLNRYDTYRTV